MLSEYGKAVVEERHARDADLARYLRWEHGAGTEVDALPLLGNGSSPPGNGARARPGLLARALARARLVRA